ncbi:MAG: hypothetical protein MUF51_08500 [Vicinamibacteria bacterium]|jgi:hypothetical protein|nr:hypothetical protein [Vicinamibacteria bacterium]
MIEPGFESAVLSGPPAAAPPVELIEEARVGGSTRGRAVNAALLALSRAARSFLLYDPSNTAIHQFIADLREKMSLATREAGAIALEVRPFDLALDGEVVYTEPDRERSLAFRLFRDGVRRLTIQSSVEWDELLRLLEILSIRYTGVRQNEDDVVTLLWKAGFRNIGIEAVEGFLPEEEELHTERRERRTDNAALQARMPADWDLPARALDKEAEIHWRDVPAAEREALCAEEATTHLSDNAVKVVLQMTALAADSEDTTTFDEILPLLGEVRDFLLSEGQLAHLFDLVRGIQSRIRNDPQRAEALITPFADRRALGLILHSVAKTSAAPPIELVGLLDSLPTDHLTHLIDLLGEERGEASRRLTRQLIERYGKERLDVLTSRMRQAAPGVICDLLRALARMNAEAALEAAIEMAEHPDVTVVFEAMRRFDKAPAGARVSRTLIKLLDSSAEDVRLRALELLGRRSEQAVFGPLAKWVEQHSHKMNGKEAELAGRILARLSPHWAMDVFKDWLQHHQGLVARLLERGTEHMLEWTAAAGLEILPGQEPDELIQSIAKRADGELRKYCQNALARRRQKRAGRG